MENQEFVRTQPYHFTIHERARLLILRGRVMDDTSDRYAEPDKVDRRQWKEIKWEEY